MNDAEREIRERLFALQDTGYAAFHSKLMPTVDPARVIGVRTPALRALARELAKEPLVPAFMAALPHRYYEEDNLHGLFIERMAGYDDTIAALETFLPHVDNWATCDLIRPKAFKKHPAELPDQVRVWMASGHTYTMRFGMGVLLWFYLDDAFDPVYLEWVAAVESGEYYVNMMRAWYFATALAKQWEATIPYLEERRLDAWTHAKTIQKARESFRISADEKAYLQGLK